MAEMQKIKLMSSDNAEITVGMSQLVLTCLSCLTQRALLTAGTDRDVAERSVLIKNMMEDIGEQAMTEAIPIPNVRSHHSVKPLREANLPP